MIKNINEGNVDLTGDYKIPVAQLEEIDDDIRLCNLEDRVSHIESILKELKSDCFITATSDNKSVKDKIRSFFRL